MSKLSEHVKKAAARNDTGAIEKMFKRNKVTDQEAVEIIESTIDKPCRMTVLAQIVKHKKV